MTPDAPMLFPELQDRYCSAELLLVTDQYEEMLAQNRCALHVPAHRQPAWGT